MELVNRMTNRLWGLSKRLVTESHQDSVRLVPQIEVSATALETCIRVTGLDVLPNDLTRMLYLASLRDCNSGRYLHPELSPMIGVEEADHALSACHDQVFRRLLKTSISAYVLQLEEYIRYTRADRDTVLRTWQSLQAYRSTVPLQALPIYSDLFCLNTELALVILNYSRWIEKESYDAMSRSS
ncbi:MAG: hypothetical protein JWN74_2962 [Acidobacteriaceae bacterium]|nr:hypothetical protein [Acidobacteriaceae bacterium]